MTKPYLNETQRFAVRKNTMIGSFFMFELAKKRFYREIYRQRVFLMKVWAIVISLILMFSFFYSGVLIIISYFIILFIVCWLIYIS